MHRTCRGRSAYQRVCSNAFAYHVSLEAAPLRYSGQAWALTNSEDVDSCLLPCSVPIRVLVQNLFVSTALIPGLLRVLPACTILFRNFDRNLGSSGLTCTHKGKPKSWAMVVQRGKPVGQRVQLYTSLRYLPFVVLIHVEWGGLMVPDVF